MPLLSEWSSFYIMTGSSAAALTGLMFVVITLVKAGEQRNRDGIATFSTPTVMHFGAALLVSAILVAPWRSLLLPSISAGLVGAYELVYLLRVTLRAKGFTGYQPDAEDWAWYTVMPLLACGLIFAGAIATLVLPAKGLFVVAGGVVLLIFIGIRNAWDIVTYIAISR